MEWNDGAPDCFLVARLRRSGEQSANRAFVTWETVADGTAGNGNDNPRRLAPNGGGSSGEPIAEGKRCKVGTATAMSFAAANDTAPETEPAPGLDVGAEALGGLLVAEYRSLVSYSRRLTANGPEATDLVQMVCARVLSRPSRDWPANVAAWLRTILYHMFVDLRRRGRWEIPTETAALDQRAVASEPELTNLGATIDDVRAQLPSLPAHYRVPYELYTFDNMSYESIADRLGVPCRTVGTRINRARKLLRDRLQARYRR